MIRRALRLGLWLYAIGVGVTFGSAVLTPGCDRLVEELPHLDAIIVLGGDMNDDGRIGPSSIRRVEAAVALYLATKPDHFVATGGDAGFASVPAGRQMIDLAYDLGVPRRALVAETGSYSTLQNALFSLPLVPEADRIVLVSDGFHLWRSWASFAWAGTAPVALCKSSVFGVSPSEWPKTLLLEPVKLALNLVRASFWSILGRVGLQGRAPSWFLA